MDGVWVPIIMLATTAFVLAVWLYYRYRTQQALQDTVQAAIEKGHELSPELLDRLGKPSVSGDADLRRGTISLAIGVAFGILALVVNEPDAVGPMLGAGAFPTMIGVAYIGLWLFAGKKDG